MVRGSIGTIYRGETHGLKETDQSIQRLVWTTYIQPAFSKTTQWPEGPINVSLGVEIHDQELLFLSTHVTRRAIPPCLYTDDGPVRSVLIPCIKRINVQVVVSIDIRAQQDDDCGVNSENS